MIHPSDRELLLWIDHEIAPDAAVDIELHVNNCQDCRARADQMQGALTGLVQLYRSELRTHFSNGEREVLKTAQRGGLSSHRLAEAAVAVCAIGLVLFLGLTITLQRSRNVALVFTPNVQLTPGAVSSVSVQEVCSGSLSNNDPAVPDPLKRAVFREYGLKDTTNDSYELDFLVTPQLGGATSIRNLWPQPARRAGWNARAKDELEDRLHSLVCSGQLDLPTAQRELSQDWVAAYKKYFRTNQPRTTSELNGAHLAGTSRIRCSVASSTALRENGIG